MGAGTHKFSILIYNLLLLVWDTQFCGHNHDFAMGELLFYLLHILEERKALTTEIDCDQTAMGLPPVRYALFLIAG
jgi:hypothetical protein